MRPEVRLPGLLLLLLAFAIAGAAIGALGGLLSRLFFATGPEGWESAWLGESWLHSFFASVP